MTKRESFARVEVRGKSVSWIEGDGWRVESVYHDVKSNEHTADKINYAFEARVKEEVRKALDKFKSMLRILCVKCGMPEHIHCEMDEPGVDHASSCEKFHHEFKPEEDKK